MRIDILLIAEWWTWVNFHHSGQKLKRDEYNDPSVNLKISEYDYNFLTQFYTLFNVFSMIEVHGIRY